MVSRPPVASLRGSKKFYQILILFFGAVQKNSISLLSGARNQVNLVPLMNRFLIDETLRQLLDIARLSTCNQQYIYMTLWYNVCTFDCTSALFRLLLLAASQPCSTSNEKSIHHLCRLGIMTSTIDWATIFLSFKKPKKSSHTSVSLFT